MNQPAILEEHPEVKKTQAVDYQRRDCYYRGFVFIDGSGWI